MKLRYTSLCIAWIAASVIAPNTADCQEKTSARSLAWTESKIKGSPDPPLPYKATRVFSKVELDRPTDVVWMPSANKWIATQHQGKLVMFDNDPDGAIAEPFLDLSEALGERVFNAYAVLFHPDQTNHPWCFVTFVSKQKDPQGVQLGRLRVLDPTVPTIDPDSLQILTRWDSGGHAGGTMQFGPDGMLYFAVGDGQGPYPPDAKNVGQDLSNIQGAIMRIDVNDPTAEQPYRIPHDNPFVGKPDVREEIWSFGLRNPWKIAFDPVSGDLLAADVGWEMREMIHRVERGRNHGWSIMEGSQPVKQEQSPDVPITAPLFEHTHVDSRSISGGHYWQSDRVVELKGAYIYGDWMTGKVWALKHEGDEVLWQKELVDTPLQVIGFMLGPTGEVMILAYDGTILRIDPNVESATQTPFPRRLTETGVFSDVAKQQPAKGVFEYEISAHHWADGTHSRQWIAVPGNDQLSLYEKDDWTTGDTKGRFDFPTDTVLAKTVSYFADTDDPKSERRIETQLLHRYEDDWRAYNYVWNDEQTDAILQDDVASERKLVIKDRSAPKGLKSQTWRHASRSECLLCHIWAAGSVHAFWPEQLNIDIGGDIGKDIGKENQLGRFTKIGLFKKPVSAASPPASPHDSSQPLESRARSYLALNCSTCHRPQGGGTADFNFDWTKTLEANNYLDAAPAQGTFGIADARVVASGDPLRSVMVYRMLKSGRGHMPQFGSNVIDMQGVQLLHDWIESLADDESKTSRGSTITKHEIHKSLRYSANFTGELIESSLANTSGAMALSLICGDQSTDAKLREQIIRLGSAHDQPEIRDLFEHYLPEEQRIKRLGPTIDVNALLAMEGSIEHGKILFEQAKDVNCRACHRIGSIGEAIGPDLSGIGVQQKPGEILDSILNPSNKIDPKFRAREIVRFDGKVIVGIVTEETDEQVILIDSNGKSHTVSVDDIDEMQPATKSAMPDLLLSGMTAQQAADLLAYLSAQRKTDSLQQKQ